jgi:hypothetical protein
MTDLHTQTKNRSCPSRYFHMGLATKLATLTSSTALSRGVRRGAFGQGTALQAGRSRVQFPVVSLEFFIDIILPGLLWPWD